MQQVKGPLHRRAGLFAAPADEMAGDFSSPLPFFVHSPGMRLYALMPRGAFFPLRREMMAGDFSGSPALFRAFPWNAVVCAHAARGFSRFGGG